MYRLPPPSDRLTATTFPFDRLRERRCGEPVGERETSSGKKAAKSDIFRQPA
ncbi:Uncharacterized protein dnm_065590 [Desulfonema magnum]|uniref:Uncharacterized protein n=1 Tax=Desulfonema magnum TaxID=45655 RepID=A0A975BSB5_9BACT|nr:Uncharacterized protein dnm_065590 [Desulfonema magnum]